MEGQVVDNWLYRIYVLGIEKTDSGRKLVGDKPLASFLMIADDLRAARRKAELTWARENGDVDVDSFIVWAERVTNG
jgi:hypothetical protein